MTNKNILLISLFVLLVLLLTGCGHNARTSSAEQRWNRVLEQAQIEAAHESIEQGRLSYAIQLLEELVDSNSAFAPQAEQVLIKLRAVTQEFAQARGMNADIEQQFMLN